MESKKINQLATEMTPTGSDLTIIGDPITGVSRKITLLQLSATIGTGADLQGVTDNGATTTNPIAIGGLTITGLATGALLSTSGVISSVPYGAANGVATLGGDGKVPSIQLPSYVDDVVEVANFAALPVTGETGKLYITLDNNKVYRWTGSIYVEIAANNAVWGAITGTLSNQTDLQSALNAKVPYTGATANVNLGLFDLYAQNILATDTSGNWLSALTRDGGTAIGVLALKSGGFTNYLQPITTVSSARTWTLPDASGTIALTSDIPSLTGYVPYTGATTNVNLGTFDLTADVITGATGSFASSGGSDTFAINHSSGSGIALNITKGGNGEGLYINKTSGSGNAATIIGTLNATTLVKSGGTSSQFLKADGSVDSSTYLTTSAAASTYVTLGTTQTITGDKTFDGNNVYNGVNTYNTHQTRFTAGIAINQTLSGGAVSSHTVIGANVNGLNVNFPAGGYNSLNFASTSVSNTYTFPNATGTIALTSNLSAYLPLTGGTLTGVLNGTSATFSGNMAIGSSTTALSPLQVVATGTIVRLGEQSGTTGKQFLIGIDATSGRTELQSVWQGTGFTSLALQPSGGNVLIGTTTDNGAKLQVTGDATFSSSVTASAFSSDGSQLFSFYIKGRASDNFGAFGFYSNNGATRYGYIQSGSTNGGQVVLNGDGGGSVTLDNRGMNVTGAATFSSSVTANGILTVNEDGASTKVITIRSNWAGVDPAINVTTNNPLLLMTNNTEQMRITSGGNVLMGTTSNNGYKLQINDSGGNLITFNRSAANAAMFMGGVTGATTEFYVQANGSGGVYLISGGVAWIAASDERLKTDLVPIEDAANKVSSLRSVIGRYKTDAEGTKRAFLIAQDVIKVLPEAVNKNQETGDLGVSYTEVIPLLVAAIKEQQAQIEELKAKIK
jgi:hypothetical protein